MSCRLLNKALHGVDGLKAEVKGDLNDQTVSATYTAIADASVKVETKVSNPAAFNAECLYSHASGAIVGAKFNGLNIPNVGLSFATGDIFASILNEKFPHSIHSGIKLLHRGTI